MDPEIATKVDRFFKQYKHQLFKKGEVMIRADEDPSGVFYLLNGQVKQYAISPKGDDLIVNIFKSNVFFPMSWAINKSPNTYYYEALTEVEAWRAPAEDVVEFVKANPDVLFNLIKRLYSGMDGVLSRMVFLMSGEASKRILAELLISAKRFGKKSSEDKAIMIEITEQELANQTGMARETISRELTKLKEKQLITTQNKQIIIPDLNMLELELSAI
jgi:CRP/FNR family transcriptional regulator, anaerobic regulatory protein